MSLLDDTELPLVLIHLEFQKELLELLSRLATTASLRGWVGFTLECRHALRTK